MDSMYRGLSKNFSITCVRGAFPFGLYSRFHSFKLLDDVAKEYCGYKGSRTSSLALEAFTPATASAVSGFQYRIAMKHCASQCGASATSRARACRSVSIRMGEWPPIAL